MAIHEPFVPLKSVYSLFDDRRTPVRSCSPVHGLTYEIVPLLVPSSHVSPVTATYWPAPVLVLK